MLQTRDGCTRVIRRRNERFAKNCVLEVDNFGGGVLTEFVALVNDCARVDPNHPINDQIW
jgi:hypothetical protein